MRNIVAMKPNLVQIFRDALDVEAADRAAFLNVNCPDPELRLEVERLLAAIDDTGLPLALTPGALLGVTQATGGGQGTLNVDRAGTHIGPFRLVRLLGQGGMGAVWLGTRITGFAQDVAIKWAHSGGLSPANTARFAQEREVLAALSHPGIARIVDGGDDQGALWFAMEYVEGQVLDDYIAAHRPSLEARLRLIIALCSAVQYAHQHLVVHRDLKPSNIMVQADGAPKLLDFGVAKQLDSVAELTQSRAPMTFSYAAPEQIRGEPITTAVDVYALGVILFELLTGERPHKPKGDGSLSLLQAITDTDASAPSSALALRTNAPSFIKPSQLRGDLDTIVLKALNRDPLRRYASAQALRDDLSRFLAREPILASPDSFAYRAGKWLRRNPITAVAAAFAGISLLVLTLISFDQAKRANSQRDRADVAAASAAFERDEALQQLSKQEALREHFIAVINSATEGNAPITSEKLLGLAANTALVQSAQNAQNQLALKLAIAEVFLLRADYPKALALLDDAQTLLPTGTDLEKASEASVRLYALISMGDIAQAEQVIARAQKLKLAGQASDLAKNILVFKGRIAQAKGDAKGAVAYLERAAELAEVASSGTALDRGTTVANLAVLQIGLGNYAAALQAAERAELIWQSGGAAENAQSQTLQSVKATVLLQLGLVVQARAEYEKIAERGGDSPPAKAARLMSQARVELLLGDFNAARKMIEPVISLMCSTVGESSQECARAYMATLEVELNLSAVSAVANNRAINDHLVQIQNIQKRASSPANTTLVVLYAALVAAHEANNQDADTQVSAAIEALKLRASEGEAGRYIATRHALMLAFRLQLQQRPEQAKRVADFAQSIQVKTNLLPDSIDQLWLVLWRAEVSGDVHASKAALTTLKGKFGEHPFLRGW